MSYRLSSYLDAFTRIQNFQKLKSIKPTINHQKKIETMSIINYGYAILSSKLDGSEKSHLVPHSPSAG
jgi:hypothetical protein